MVEAPAAAVAGALAPGPARFAAGIALECAKCVVVPQLAEAWHDPELACVPPHATLGTKLSARIPCERENRPVRQLAPRGVEVAAQHAGTGRSGCQAASDRFERVDLDPAVAGVRDVDTVHFDRAIATIDNSSDNGLAPRREQPRDGLQRLPGGEQDTGSPSRGRLPCRI